MRIEKNKSLKELTTFGIGGNAKFFCNIVNESDIVEAIDFSIKEKVSFFILGGGSNILISDEGFQGLVMKMDNKGIEFKEERNGNVYVKANAGENWDEFIIECVNRELYGIENLSYIPGTIGATPVQNIGAYGSEAKDTIYEVRVYDTKTKKFYNMKNSDCDFSYRNSIFKKEKRKYIIISVIFLLSRNRKINISYKDLKEYLLSKRIKDPTLKEIRNAVIDIRESKLPNTNFIGTAGSFFKNPVINKERALELEDKYPGLPIYPTDDINIMKVSLAWIIDHVCQYKNKKKGNVGIYKNQALAIINEGNATAHEVLDFADEIKGIVREKTGIDIEMEVEYVL